MITNKFLKFWRFMSSIDTTVNPITWWIALSLISFAQFSNFISYHFLWNIEMISLLFFTQINSWVMNSWYSIKLGGLNAVQTYVFLAHNGLLRIYTSWGVYGALNFKFSNFYWHFSKIEGKECTKVWKGTFVHASIYVWYNTFWICCFNDRAFKCKSIFDSYWHGTLLFLGCEVW